MFILKEKIIFSFLHYYIYIAMNFCYVKTSAKILVIIAFVYVISMIPIYKSVVDFPREGISGDGGFFLNSKSYHLFYLYKGDRLSFYGRADTQYSYRVIIEIRGVLTDLFFNWSETFDVRNPRLPVFIAPKSDWYFINFTTVSSRNELDGFSYSNAVFEITRSYVADKALNIFPYIAVIILVSYALTTFLSAKYRWVRRITWDLGSSYLWILIVVAAFIFIDLFSQFRTSFSLADEDIRFLNENNYTYPKSTYILTEGIYWFVPVDTLIQLFLILGIMVNLINVSYMLDRKFYRIDASIDKGLLKTYLVKWFVGFLILLIPYIMTKFYIDILSFEDFDALYRAYSEGLALRLLIDVYTVFYYYSIIYSLAYLIRNISIAIPIILAPLLVYLWGVDVALIKIFYRLPFSLRFLLLQGCLEPSRCINLEMWALLPLPFMLLISTYLINRFRDLG